MPSVKFTRMCVICKGNLNSDILSTGTLCFTTFSVWEIPDRVWKMIMRKSLCHFLKCVLSLECNPGSYGAGCEKKCACPPGVSCDHVTGQCQRKCPPGRHGENCDQGRWPYRRHTFLFLKSSFVFSVYPHVQISAVWLVSDCPEGRFGPGCAHPCNCTSAPCDQVTGQCKCPAGTSGKHCESCECRQVFSTAKCKISTHSLLTNDKNMNIFFTVCPEGFWGRGCTEACPACENGGMCDKHNGSCSCPPGFMGRFCQNCEYQRCAFLVSIARCIKQSASWGGRLHSGILKSCSGAVWTRNKEAC